MEISVPDFVVVKKLNFATKKVSQQAKIYRRQLPTTHCCNTTDGIQLTKHSIKAIHKYSAYVSQPNIH